MKLLDLTSVGILFSISLSSCTKNNKHQIELYGEIKNLPMDQVYLVDASNWQVLLDSSAVVNDKFVFRLDTSKYKQPFFASIRYLNNNGKFNSFGIINYVYKTKEQNANTGFMLSYGKTNLYGDWNNKFHKIEMIPNVENDLAFDPNIERTIASKKAKKVETLISQNPRSFYIISKLNQYKHHYTKPELDKFLSLFSSRLVVSYDAVKIKDYIHYLREGNKVSLHIAVIDSLRSNILLNTTAMKKLNIFVFWASWCGPCRAEIPQLKTLLKNSDSNLVSLKSISIDESFDKWKSAMVQEQMTWDQFLVQEKDLLKLKGQFKIGAIPKVVFLNSKSEVVYELEGFEPSNIDKYSDFIRTYLASNR